MNEKEPPEDAGTESTERLLQEALDPIEPSPAQRQALLGRVLLRTRRVVLRWLGQEPDQTS